ncbi:zinc-binding alcohol dehydrogenase family protein [Streptomyces sp. TRM 70361]|uniref:zinc-binding alcohol dehydrogenase family protein n=1 Tax=Streptomyces sp. TRM 70361 TaxID=3116553 RepID=UPI002E7B0F47|nr:zinc-binding alcohol dehydrogenase family protein [Streptomyces sp. TRM 70361]MEE1940623.1 zinc-binding alcohol dehydrogenase family protein [Streptomyces sp. TRM 70361]
MTAPTASTPTAPATTRAIAALAPGDVDAESSFAEVEIEVGPPGPHDLLVEVRAVSVNPVDFKVRSGFDPAEAPKVLGYDAAGVVVATGAEVTAFSTGDEVYYAGSIARTGANAGLHLVDERITGRKPASLDFAQAAAAPLTTITAWETLFDKLRLTRESTGTLLVMGAAGGVGSMLVQLARKLTGVTVIAAAGRKESAEWAASMGAHHTVDRHRLNDEVRALAPRGVDYVFSPFSAGMAETYASLMAVHGQVVAIDGPEGLDTLPLKARSQSWHWELMFTRPLFDPESTAQREILDEAARLFDAGVLRSTLSRKLTPVSPENLRDAHRALEGWGMIGKIAVANS